MANLPPIGSLATATVPLASTIVVIGPPVLVAAGLALGVLATALCVRALRARRARRRMRAESPASHSSRSRTMENLVAVALEEVSKHYGGGSEPVAVLREVSLRVSAGDFVAILGPSGSGKSTLLNLVAGLDSPSAGRVLVGGRDLAYLGDNARSDLRLREIGFVFQSFNLFPTFTAEENVAWPLELLGVPWREARRRAEEALAQVALPPAAARRRPAALSGGEQQRVAIARALVTEPRLLLADEPTGNLDSQTGQTILDLLRRLNEERHLTVVLVTHNALAASHAQRTIELRDGRIVREARGTITIMFSDIVGFSAMTERLGDERVQEILHTHCAIVREQISVHGGFEVKTQGDGFMLAFPSARRALRCAVAIQRATAAYDEHAEAPVRLRIGLHTGEATKEGYDFFGRSVIVAARIGAAARSGEILVSSLVRELTGGAEEFAFDGGRELELKGLSGLQRVFGVEWQGSDPARAWARGNGAAPTPAVDAVRSSVTVLRRPAGRPVPPCAHAGGRTSSRRAGDGTRAAADGASPPRTAIFRRPRLVRIRVPIACSGAASAV